MVCLMSPQRFPDIPAGCLQRQDYSGQGEKKHKATPSPGGYHSVPVRVGGGQHELEFHHAGVVFQLPVLYAIKFIGDISPSNIHLVKK